MAEEKKSSVWVWLITILVVCALVVGLIFIFKPSSNAQSVMEISVNPKIQFVLDGGNRVIGANALNEDGEKILANVEFDNLTAEEASKLFVEVSTQFGYINVSTTGTRVDITVIGDEENLSKLEKLQTKVENSVNEFFDENGIIAGAVASVSTNIQNALFNLGVSAREYANLTNQEVLTLLQTKTADLEGVAVELRADLTNEAEILYNNIVKLAEDALTMAEQTLNEIPDTLTAVKKQAQDAVNQAKSQLNQAKATFEKEIKELIEILKEESETYLADLKQNWDNMINAGKNALEQHKTNFENNKTQIQTAINDFRESLA